MIAIINDGKKEIEPDDQFNFKFGNEVRNGLFYLKKGLFFTNHGSYGSVPKIIYEKRKELQFELEQAPDIWFRYTSIKLWNSNRQALAIYLNINSDNLVLTENATDSINSIVKAIDFNGSKDAIIANDFTYNAVLNTLYYSSQYRFENNNVQVFKVPITFPLTVSSLVDSYDKLCEAIVKEKKLRIRLVLIDHISSASATLYPLKEIISVVRKWEQVQNDKCLVLIDGAHCIGQVKIHLNEIDCDYYISNLHKWFFSPRGNSFLYFKNNEDSKKIQPNIISHDFGNDAKINFFQRGTRDNTSWFLIEDCIKFYENYFGGLDNIERYTSLILDKAVDILVKNWNSEKLDLEKELEAPFMKLIKLPLLKNYVYNNADEALLKSVDLQKDLYEKYNHIACIVVLKGELYARISCFVYNKLEDYLSLKDAILDLNK